MIAHMRAELGGRYVDGASARVAEREHAVAGVRIEVAVADEVQDVHGVLSQPPLQFGQRRVLQPVDDHETGSFGLSERATDACPFVFDVEPLKIMR